MSAQKYYLDTSVVRQLFSAPTAYRRWLKARLSDGTCYVNSYICMEVRRGFIIPLIRIYYILKMPTLESMADVHQFIANEYSPRLLSAYQQATGDMIELFGFDEQAKRDKEDAARQLARYIRRVDIKLRRKFKNTGVDSSRCKRAEHGLECVQENAEEKFRSFREDFDDTQSCREACRIGNFFTDRYRSESEKCVDHSEDLPKNNKTRSFIKLTNKLEEGIEEGNSYFNCQKCGWWFGDAAIAFDAPDGMQLESLDNCHTHICDAVGRSYRHYRSVTNFFDDPEDDA